jgi:hypothetical protein
VLFFVFNLIDFVETVIEGLRKEKKLEKFQTIDEVFLLFGIFYVSVMSNISFSQIFLELDEQKQKRPPSILSKKEKTPAKERPKIETYDSDDSSDDGSRRRHNSIPRKTISWRYSRTPSPVPPSSRKSRTPSPVPLHSGRKSRTPSPVPSRSMSDHHISSSHHHGHSPYSIPGRKVPTPILTSLPSPTAASPSNLNSPTSGLPYNIKTKKRNARRIQSIHHMMSESSTSSVPSSSDQEKGTTSQSETDSQFNLVGVVRSPSAGGGRVKSPVSPSVAAYPGSTTDFGTTSAEDTNSLARSKESGDDLVTLSGSSTGNATMNKHKGLLVPCRLSEGSLVDLSMIPKPFTVKDQIRLATLLSTQEAKFGFNMFDSLIPGDNEETSRLMSMGIRYEDAVLIIFEKRYVTKPHEHLRSSPVPIPEYKTHALASIPAPAAVQLGSELARSMSPKPRPVSMPVASHTRGEFFGTSVGGGNQVVVPGHLTAENTGDYGLNYQQYPGYSTVHSSLTNTRANSPLPAGGYHSYSGSAQISRSHSPLVHHNGQPPIPYYQQMQQQQHQQQFHNPPAAGYIGASSPYQSQVPSRSMTPLSIHQQQNQQQQQNQLQYQQQQQMQMNRNVSPARVYSPVPSQQQYQLQYQHAPPAHLMQYQQQQEHLRQGPHTSPSPRMQQQNQHSQYISASRGNSFNSNSLLPQPAQAQAHPVGTPLSLSRGHSPTLVTRAYSDGAIPRQPSASLYTNSNPTSNPQNPLLARHNSTSSPLRGPVQQTIQLIAPKPQSCKGW